MDSKTYVTLLRAQSHDSEGLSRQSSCSGASLGITHIHFLQGMEFPCTRYEGYLYKQRVVAVYSGTCVIL